jgi:hypothetical protein
MVWLLARCSRGWFYGLLLWLLLIELARIIG